MKLNTLCSSLIALALAAPFTVGCGDISEFAGEEIGSTEKILGGQDAKSQDWMVAILRNGNMHWGGTLIHAR